MMLHLATPNLEKLQLSFAYIQYQVLENVLINHQGVFVCYNWNVFVQKILGTSCKIIHYINENRQQSIFVIETFENLI